MADSHTVITPYRDGPLLVRGPFNELHVTLDVAPLGITGYKAQTGCADTEPPSGWPTTDGS